MDDSAIDDKIIAELIPEDTPRKTIRDVLPKWEYASLEEKHAFFDYSNPKFNSVDELLRQLEQLSLQANAFLFRGVSKDTYKLVSSAQRRWRELRCRHCIGVKTSYSDYLTGLLGWMKCAEGVLPKCPGNCFADHQVWGYLQHYGCPTPFIDFSQSYLVALHMAVRRIQPGQKQGISVYAIQEGGSQMQQGNDLCDLDFSLTGGTTCIGGQTDISEPEFARRASFSEWKDNYAWMIRELYRLWCPKLKTRRIETQTGLFVYSSEEETPFEKLIFQKNSDVDENGDPNGNTLHRLKCFDIPRSMIPELKKRLIDEGIDDEAVGLRQCETDALVRQALVQYEDFFLKNPISKFHH